MSLSPVLPLIVTKEQLIISIDFVLQGYNPTP